MPYNISPSKESILNVNKTEFQMETFPKVRLLNYFDHPYNNSVAAARTCYSSRVILPSEVDENEERKKQRDRIAKSIYKAGHHTTIQHSSFQFILEKVSRQFIWSFLHSHPFYNSEQVSQRYVEVKPENFYIPSLPLKALAIYLETIRLQMQTYKKLIAVLKNPVEKKYNQIFPHRDPELKKWQQAIKKRCMEIARYVLPVATLAHLYHSVSGLTIHRYHRLCEQLDVPHETKRVIDLMIKEIEKIDPEFSKNLEDPIPLEQTLEFRFLDWLKNNSPYALKNTSIFLKEFDSSLKGKTSLLIGYVKNAEKNMAMALRSIFGIAEKDLSNSEALEKLLNPAQNPYLAEALNINSLSKMMRPLQHFFFTFRKKLSHTADSQDQRHRLTPGSRPLLTSHFQLDQPDFVLPPLIEHVPEALDIYQKVMSISWDGITKLLNLGASLEQALYLLPNAFPIRFEESGDLMAFHHKWTTRLCYTAQEEIWQACYDEVTQVKDLYPQIGKFLHPPCTLRKMAKETPYCPEGDRFCGVRVWNLQIEDFNRLL